MATNNNNPVIQNNPQNPAPSVTAIDIFNSLRVPDAIKDLPKFDGNPRLLFDFLDNVDEILSLISIVSGTGYGQLLLRAIRNKIVGPANEILNMYGTELNWDKIKENLILHYSDKRNETSLIRDLHKIKQNNNTVEKFYSEVVELFAGMTNHVNIHASDLSVIHAKKSLYAEMCLNAFLSGLREPLGSTIRAMKPQTLAEAFAYCIKEQNIFYAKSDPNKYAMTTKLVQNSPANTHRRHIPQHQYKFQNRIQPQFFGQQQRFSPPQNFTQQPRFSQPNNFPQQQRPQYFNRQNFTPLPKPEPMDTSSGNQRTNYYQSQNKLPFNKPFRPSGQPNFVSKELFNVTERKPTVDPIPHQPNSFSHQQNLDNYYDYENDYSPNYLNDSNLENNAPAYNELDDGNFTLTASTDLSGI